MTILIPIVVVIASVLDRPIAVKTFKQAAAVIQRDAGVKFRPRFRVRPMPRPDLSRQQYAVVDYAPFAEAPSGGGGERVFLLLDPARDPWGRKIGTGQAAICGRLGLATMAPTPQTAKFAVMHELGHMLGATHIAEGLMNPDPLGMAVVMGSKIGFAAESVAEIEACIGQG